MVLELVKKLFNVIFKEETKEKLRNKFEKVFVALDKRIVYREYLKACKYILRRKIYGHRTLDYEYRTDSSLEKIKEEYLYTKLKSEMSKGDLHMDEEMREILERVREDGFDVYCGSLKNVCMYSDKDIEYDTKNELFYGMYQGKRLYFSRKFHTVGDVLKYMNEIAAEQSEHSPHRYLTSDFNVDNEDVVFDIGCAEGNLTLSVIDKVKEAYLFENEEEWIKPLKLTFAPYADKVHIIQKFVSKKSGAQTVSIDDFCVQNKIKQIGLMKMDVEGTELDVLVGAKRMIEHNKIHKMAICTYHKVHDEQAISAILQGYRKSMSEGYMLHTVQSYELWNMELPYFTRGVMRAVLEQPETVVTAMINTASEEKTQ